MSWSLSEFPFHHHNAVFMAVLEQPEKSKLIYASELRSCIVGFT